MKRPSAKRSTGPVTVVPPAGNGAGSDGGGLGSAGCPETSGVMSGRPPFGVVAGTDTTSPAASMASMRSDDRDVRTPASSSEVDASATTPDSVSRSRSRRASVRATAVACTLPASSCSALAVDVEPVLSDPTVARLADRWARLSARRLTPGATTSFGSSPALVAATRG